MYPQGDRSAPPSGRMPAGGFYFDAIVHQQHFNEDHLDPLDNTEEFQLISEAELEYSSRKLNGFSPEPIKPSWVISAGQALAISHWSRPSN